MNSFRSVLHREEENSYVPSPTIAVACGYPEHLCNLWIKNEDRQLIKTSERRVSTDDTDILNHHTLPLPLEIDLLIDAIV